MKKTKPPSQLWNEASPEARSALSKLLGEIHLLWQRSDHYSPMTELERTPRAFLKCEWRSDLNEVTYRWAGDGVDRAIIVEIDARHPTFLLLGNEQLIYLLNGWLAISGVEGLPEEPTLEDMDKFDFRGKLESIQNKPTAIIWAMKDLYDLCLAVNAQFAQHGFDGWGFWDEKRKDDFSCWTREEQTPPEFQDLDDVFKNDRYPDAFRKICQSGDYSYDVSGLIRYTEDFTDGHDYSNGGVRLGRLEEFLRHQEPLSVLFMIGQAYGRLEQVSKLTYENEPFQVNREGYERGLPNHYSPYEMADDLISVGKYLAKIEWRIREERRALLARRFDNAFGGRQQAANAARSADTQKREALVAQWMKNTDLEPFRARTTGRLKVAPMARAFLETEPFAGKIKSSVGPKQVERLIKRILKRDISPK